MLMSAHVQSVKGCGKMKTSNSKKDGLAAKTSNSKKDGLAAIHVIDGTILGVLDFVECHQNELHLSADIVDKSVITTDSLIIPFHSMISVFSYFITIQCIIMIIIIVFIIIVVVVDIEMLFYSRNKDQEKTIRARQSDFRN